MGRGCGWSDAEIAHIVRAWVYASEDPVTGIDQTAGRFKSTMFEKFKELGPNDVHDKRYGGRSAKSARAKFEEVAADVQKFRDAILRVRASNPTGVTEDEVLSMSIAVHFGKRDKMSYEARCFPHAQWRSHLAYKVLQSHPKFSDERCLSSMSVGRIEEGGLGSEENGGDTDGIQRSEIPGDQDRVHQPIPAAH